MRPQLQKNRYSGYALMPQSLEQDWWLIVKIEANKNGSCRVYHVQQVIGFEKALKAFQALNEQSRIFNDGNNNARLIQLSQEV